MLAATLALSSGFTGLGEFSGVSRQAAAQDRPQGEAQDEDRVQGEAEGTLPETRVRPATPQAAPQTPGATQQPPYQPYRPPYQPPYDPQSDLNPRDLGNFAEQPAGPSGESLLDYGDQLDGGSRSPLNLLQDPSHRSVIDLQQLTERSPAEMFDAIQQEAGVLVQRTQRGAAAPFVRGLTGQQVLILVDGIRLNNATFRSGPNQYFNTIDPGMVQRIEVLRGPQAVLYGSEAMGGVINVVTRSARNRFNGYESHGSWTNRVSTADLGYYTRVNGEATSGQVAAFAGAGYANYNDLDRGGMLGRQPGTSYDQHSGDGKVEFLLDKNSMLTVAIQHFSQQNVVRSDRLPGRLTIFDPQQRSLSYVRYQAIDLPGLFDRMMFTASYQRQKEGVFDHRLTSTNIDRSEIDNTSFGINWLASSDLGPAGRLTYGVDMNYDTVDAVKDRYNSDTGLFVESLVPTYPDDGVYMQTGAYMQWNVDLTHRLSAQSGMRYTYVYGAGTPFIDVDDDGDPGTPPVPTPVRISPSFDNWSATAGLNYEISEGLHGVFSVSEGFRAPNLDDLAANNDNVQQDAADTPSVDLRPEQSVGYDLGLKAESRRMRGQLFYFWTDIEDMILRTPAGAGAAGTLFSRSNRDARVHGLEASGAVDIGSCWELYGNMSYILGNDEELDEPLSRIPPTQGIVGARWRDTRRQVYVDMFAWLVDRQDRLNFQDVSDSRIPAGGTAGYATFNLRTGMQLTPHQRVGLNLENIFDTAYRVHGSGVDGPGFSAIVSYELSR